jgi:hypothetical protein
MSTHLPSAFADYVPVELRHRHDGWTPARQLDFLIALSETACVDEACRTVGMSPGSAYALRRRIDARAFRAAWDAALDYGVGRLADAALSRALHGVARPVFYKGELVGERRYYDERLTMFVLRLRDPVRFGKWRERGVFEQDEDAAARRAEALLDLTEQDAEQAAARHRLLLRDLGEFDEADDDGPGGGHDGELREYPDSGADGA